MRKIDFDVIFVSYKELEADINFSRLLSILPEAKRVSGVKGIGNAYNAAADLAETEQFLIIDADNWILDPVDFDVPQTPQRPDIAIWKTRNAVNGLLWYNGGIKLLTKNAVRSGKRDGIDFFITLKGHRYFSPNLASENRFNFSPYNTFRTAFRECAKLASGLVRIPDAQYILNAWCNLGEANRNGLWCIRGARAGYHLGAEIKTEADLAHINNPEFIMKQFVKAGGQME